MTLLLTQMAIVLLVTVACGWLALKVGQARVIGEIIGGILVGPSLFRRFAPLSPPKSFPSVRSVLSKPSPLSAWCCSCF